MTTEFTIQKATWRDLGELNQVENECFSEDRWPFWDLIGVLTMPGVVRLKAVVEGHMAGFIAGDLRMHEGVGWIVTIGVRLAYRRMGIAAALLRECETQMNIRPLRLCVRLSNLAAQRMYDKAGYHQTQVWEAYYPGGEDALVYEKT